MARTSLPEGSINIDSINLSRALSRLEPKINRDPPARLRFSNIERAKTAASLEYARTLLLRQEHATSQLKIPAKKKHQQAALGQQRALLKKLTERFAELGHITRSEEDEDNWSEDGEDIMLQLAPSSAPLNNTRSLPTESEPPLSLINTNPSETPNAPNAPTPTRLPASSISSPSSTIRARHGREALFGPSVTTTSSDAQATFHSTSGNDQPEVSAEGGFSKATANLLASADSEQTHLTTAMLSLAAALKQSAQTFAADLDADKGTVRTTESALDKNKEGMERTSGGMARLRKMSEGKWWVTRIGMMVLIPVLWIVLLLQVFVMPKVGRF